MKPSVNSLNISAPAENNNRSPDHSLSLLHPDSPHDGVSGLLAKHVDGILRLVGENPEREGLLKTPLRVARSYQFLLSGYEMDPQAILEEAIFQESYRDIVMVRDIDIFSLCEHHLLPFFGKAHVAYIPDGHIVGLSKIPRVIDAFARRLQVQERLTIQIRDIIQQTLSPLGVAVVIEANHLCMVMRGVQKQNAMTATSAMSGVFLTDQRVRSEFNHLLRGSS